ncbi:MAG: hypothetical protein R3F19_26085 [Verrucomicrobiales bacterium]
MEDRTEYCLADWAVILELEKSGQLEEEGNRGRFKGVEWLERGDLPASEASDYDMQEAKKILRKRVSPEEMGKIDMIFSLFDMPNGRYPWELRDETLPPYGVAGTVSPAGCAERLKIGQEIQWDGHVAYFKEAHEAGKDVHIGFLEDGVEENDYLLFIEHWLYVLEKAVRKGWGIFLERG